jgi:hypothetical protein
MGQMLLKNLAKTKSLATPRTRAIDLGSWDMTHNFMGIQ